MTDEYSRSVTDWIEDVKAGQDEAARRLWERYFQRLVRVARRRLDAAERRVVDEEDVALCAFHALCEGAAAGRFQRLANREDLWSLLVAITGKKAVDQVRRQTSQKRGAGKVRGHSIFDDSLLDGSGFEDLIADQPTPEFLLLVEEEHQRLLGLLRDDVQRDIARRRLAGYSNEEIAKEIGISLRSVERKLRIIRDAWMQEFEE